MSDSAASWMPAMWGKLYATGGSVGGYLEDGEGLEGEYLAGSAPSLALMSLASDGSARRVPVSAEAVDQLMEGVDPETGARLRTMRGGKRAAVQGFDQPLTVPRELAVAAVCFPDVRVALDKAMARGLDRVAGLVAAEAVARVTVDGHQVKLRADEIKIIVARHETSRAGDPHPHWHMVVANEARVGGKWYAIDSDRLFALHGRMKGVWGAALKTDPELAAALARHHLTLGADGSLPELAAEARVLGKRARVIERRVAELTAEWRRRNGLGPDAQPDARTRGMIKRQAWSETRRAKTEATTRVDWEAWYGQLLEAGLDPRTRLAALGPAGPLAGVAVPVSVVAETDIERMGRTTVSRLAAQRSAWSRDDVDAMAWTLVMETGVTGDADAVEEMHARVAAAAVDACVTLTDDPRARDPWVRALTSREVIDCEDDLRGRLAARAATPVRRGIGADDADLLDGLDAGQAAAVQAIVRGDCVVRGAAGAGKTYALSRVVQWHRRHGVGIRLLTPTLQAAQAAAGETGAEADTIDAVLWAHGWRHDELTGQWRRLHIGETWRDGEGHPHEYRGMADGKRLPRHGTIVVDEASMVDVEKACALYELADEAGCRIALVGDPWQLAQIGRGGLIDAAADWLDESQQVDMTELRRFRDPAYGEWTLKVRTCAPDQARALAAQMVDRGMVSIHAVDEETADAIAVRWSPRTSLIASTNSGVNELNRRVQAARIAAGQVDGTGPAAMSMVDGETIRVGDVIQTRQNDKAKGVANRARWTVREVCADGGVLVQDMRTHRDVTLTAGYVSAHVQLGYASTAHGAQGATAETGVLWVGDHTDRAALYVGITRGKGHNAVHVTAEDEADAIDQIAAALRRDGADRGLAAARRALGTVLQETPALPPRPPAPPQTKAVPEPDPYGVHITVTGAGRTSERPAEPKPARDEQPARPVVHDPARDAREMRILTGDLDWIGRRIDEIERELAHWMLPGQRRDLAASLARQQAGRERTLDRLHELERRWDITSDPDRDAFIHAHEPAAPVITVTGGTSRPKPRTPEAKPAPVSGQVTQSPAPVAVMERPAEPKPRPEPVITVTGAMREDMAKPAEVHGETPAKAETTPRPMSEPVREQTSASCAEPAAAEAGSTEPHGPEPSHVEGMREDTPPRPATVETREDPADVIMEEPGPAMDGQPDAAEARASEATADVSLAEARAEYGQAMAGLGGEAAIWWDHLAAEHAAHPYDPVWATPVDGPDGGTATIGEVVAWAAAPTGDPGTWDEATLRRAADASRDRAAWDAATLAAWDAATLAAWDAATRDDGQEDAPEAAELPGTLEDPLGMGGYGIDSPSAPGSSIAGLM